MLYDHIKKRNTHPRQVLRFPLEMQITGSCRRTEARIRDFSAYNFRPIHAIKIQRRHKILQYIYLQFNKYSTKSNPPIGIKFPNQSYTDSPWSLPIAWHMLFR
ncbi:hypothetical protein PUN28_014365 [Cardiocondyla obscurior]|uniref:Uncharacterized protein n=1 Tax=Cardiocondyla obscurior TaxID=286306 RepID=A0AAW2F348_9HYME